MFENKFCPSRDPSKGYHATFADYFDYCVNDGEASMDGTVQIDPNGEAVAAQLWPEVDALLTFSSGMMEKLFEKLQVSSENLSPFCREFVSLVDLRDELIKYLPASFTYNAAVGGSNVEDADDDEDDDEDDDKSQPSSLEESVANRVARFTREFDALESNNGNGNSMDEEVESTAAAAGDGERPALATKANHTALMTSFRKILAVESAEDLLEEVFVGASLIEGADRVDGAVSDARKVKSLVQRWLAKPVRSVQTSVDAVETRGILIERDTIVVIKVKLGSGASALTVSRFVRVLNIFEKYYNKWFMSKEPFKIWKKETKPYKLEVRMLDKNPLNEYVDVAVVGDATYDTDYVCMIVKDDQIVRVVGKMQQVA